MPTSAFSLAIVEVVFFSLMVPAVLYVAWEHRRPQTMGWAFILLFLVLQITGSAITVSAGTNGPPSITGAIVTGVGLSPQLLGVLGVLHESAHLSEFLKHKNITEHLKIALAIYHVGVVTAVPIYAVGQSGMSQMPPKENSASLSKAGICLLLVLWLVLAVAAIWHFSWSLRSHRSDETNKQHGLSYAILGSIALVGVRVIYQTVATLSDSSSSNHGNAAYLGGLQFLPSALMVLVLTVGGLLSRSAYKNERADSAVPITSC
jgi:hypothetical protein